MRMRTDVRAYLLVAGFSLLLAPIFVSHVFAGPPAPDFLLKAEKLETAVFLDAQIKAYPTLASNCLSEGRNWAQKQHAEIVEGRLNQKSGEVFDENYRRDYQFLSLVADRYVSIIRTDSWSPGHGAEIDTILWDRAAGRRISVRPFFRETADGGATLTAMQGAIIAALKRAKARKGLDTAEDVAAEMTEYKQRFHPSLLTIGPASLAPSTVASKSSGLIFHYGLYVIGDYSTGPFDAFVPWKILQPYLTPEGLRIFGSARPKADDEGEQ
jgi:hypothetical protein